MSELTRAEIVRNLSTLQKKMNTSPAARTAFLKNPETVLAKQGVTLSPERARKLNSFINQQVQIPQGKVTGASIRPLGAAAKTEVEVTVKVKF
jgi:hypothetical protein